MCVLLQCDATVQLCTGLLLCVSVKVMCFYNTVKYIVTVMCVCYCNVLLEYSCVQIYCYECVLL
jgi:hypothetical protein